jgi:hypothetical protein
MQHVSFARRPYCIDRANAAKAEDPRVNTKKGVGAQCQCIALLPTDVKRFSRFDNKAACKWDVPLCKYVSGWHRHAGLLGSLASQAVWRRQYPTLFAALRQLVHACGACLRVIS